jgi:chemotaxis protein CheD
VSLITVGMGDLKVSADPDGILVTYALGSCIAVIVYDQRRHAGGMIHYMLPHSSITPEKALAKPAMFADTGVPLLFEQMYALSCKKSDLIVKVVGGANIHDENGTFEIGKRNYVILRKMFWKVGVSVAAEDVGGSTSRTTRLSLATGKTTVRRSDQTIEVEL